MTIPLNFDIRDDVMIYTIKTFRFINVIHGTFFKQFRDALYCVKNCKNS